jgi:O-methyltransferase
MSTLDSGTAAGLGDAQRWLAAARADRAPGPAPSPGALGTAYLELLKLCLCDLTATSTFSVGAMPDRTVLQRELRGDERRLRAAGMDWPLQGLTMVGLRRLDDLQACLETVVAEGVAGDVIEAGSWRGGASMLARATLDVLGDGRRVYVADSFQGFPEPDAADPESDRLRDFDFLSVPLEEVRESFARLGLEEGVEFIPGFFEETIPALRDRDWALIRLDADSYEATRQVLGDLYPGLAVGGYVVVDDYGSFEGCRRAVDEFRLEHGITEELVQIDFTGARWRRGRESPAPQRRSAAGAPAPAPPPVAKPEPERHVPTAQEVRLAAELTAARAALAEAQAELGRRRAGLLSRFLPPRR